MTVSTDPGPGNNDWRSTRFTATVESAAAYVYGYERTVVMETEVWDADDLVEVSWLAIQCDQFVDVVLTRIAGAITSFKVYPDEYAKPGSVPGLVAGLQGDDLALVVPPNTRLRVELNGDRKHVVHVFTAPLVVDVGGDPGVVEYNGTQVAAVSGQTLYFPPGEHDLTAGTWGDILFPVQDNATIFIAQGAVVTGNFDLRGTDGASIVLCGTLTGLFETPENVIGMAFADAIQRSMFFGYDGTKFYFDNAVSGGGVIVAQPHYAAFYGVWSWRNVHLLAPWYWSCNGPSTSAQATDNIIGEIVDCFSFSSDDNCNLAEEHFQANTVSGSFFVNSSNACFHLSYWTAAQHRTTTVTDCHAMHLGIADNGSTALGFPAKGVNSVIHGFTDGHANEASYGRFDVTFDGLCIWGPMASRILAAGNQPYPFSLTDRRDQVGQLSNITIRDLWVQETPGQASYLTALNRRNAPNGLVLERWTIGGVPVSARNFSTYVEADEGCFAVTLDGRAVA